jgi:hypothetical protein
MVLIVVAVVIALVSLAALGFLVSMNSEDRSAHSLADQLQVQQVAASGAEYLQTLVRLPRAQRMALGPMRDNPNLFKDVRVDWDLVGQRHGRFCVLAPEYADEGASVEFRFGVQNHSGKLSLATILLWDQQEPGRGRAALMNLPGMNESLADAILDWIDRDDVPRELGAEAEFYLGLDPPRQPPNQLPARIEDLLAVRGMTAWQLLGKQDGVFVVTSDQAERVPDQPRLLESASVDPAAATTWLTPSPPWAYYLTVHSAERNESFAGQPRVDLNQPDLLALQTTLQTTLSTEVDAEVARFVIAYRQYGPASVGIEAASDDPLPPAVIAQPARFRLATPLDLVDAVVTLPQPGTASDKDDSRSGSDKTEKKTFASPFRSRDPASLSKLVDFCDQTTTEPTAVLADRINVQLATRPVLLGIPGLLPEQVDRILAAPPPGTDDAASRRHAVWLLAEGLVDLETMKRIWPFVTVGGDVWGAQIVAFYDAQSPWFRQEIVIDGTSDGASPLYYKDLRRLGIGFRWQDLVSATSADRPFAANSPRSFLPDRQP